MKQCSTCKEWKPEEAFYWKKKGVKRHTYCAKCQNDRSKANYRNNADGYKQRARKNNARYQEMVRTFVFDYLLEHPCVICGEDEPLLLDFDHLGDKEWNIAELTKTNRASLTLVKKEIKKCQVLCCRCHRIKTATEHGHYRLKMQEERFPSRWNHNRAPVD